MIHSLCSTGWEGRGIPKLISKITVADSLVGPTNTLKFYLIIGYQQIAIPPPPPAQHSRHAAAAAAADAPEKWGGSDDGDDA